jgi:hypothetical protein
MPPVNTPAQGNPARSDRCAIEAADIALMADDLAKLPWLVRDSRRALWVTIAADIQIEQRIQSGSHVTGLAVSHI